MTVTPSRFGEADHRTHTIADCGYPNGCTGCVSDHHDGSECDEDCDQDNCALRRREYDAAQHAALADGQATADRAATYWADLAAQLTAVHAHAHQQLPQLPDGHEEWYEKRQPHLPFELDELHAQLSALSGLITKAHTIAAVYRQNADYLGDERTVVAPD